jgi:ankyrin repeat protein
MSIHIHLLHLFYSQAGADFNCTNPDTPLVIATSKDLSECVKYLLEVGADANIPINHVSS